MATPLTAKERIKGAQRARRSVRVNLKGDLVAQIEQLELELADARETQREGEASHRRLAQLSSPLELAQRIEGLREQMADGWLDLTLEQQSWADWRAFKAAHPQREDVYEDEMVRVNFDDLVEKFMPTCVVEPVLDAEDWEGIFSKVAPADLRDLGAVAFTLHETGLDVPKSLMASAEIRLSGERSEQPESGESASDGTTGGSHLSSTSTTTPTESSPEAPSSPESQSGTPSPDAEPKG